MGVAAQRGKGEERPRICFHNILAIFCGRGALGECLGSGYLYITKRHGTIWNVSVVLFLRYCSVFFNGPV